MDPTPQIPPVTTDEAGTIRVGGHWPMTPSLARERAGQLMWRVEDCGGGEIVHHMLGAMTTAQAALLANELWAAAWRAVTARVLPAPAGEPA